MLLGTSAASLLGNILTGKGAGKGTISAGDGTIRAAQSF